MRTKAPGVIMIAVYIVYIALVEVLVSIDDGNHESLYSYLKGIGENLILGMVLLSYYIRVKNDDDNLKYSVLMWLLFVIFSTGSALLRINYMDTIWGRIAPVVTSFLLFLVFRKIEKTKNK